MYDHIGRKQGIRAPGSDSNRANLYELGGEALEEGAELVVDESFLVYSRRWKCFRMEGEVEDSGHGPTPVWDEIRTVGLCLRPWLYPCLPSVVGAVSVAAGQNQEPRRPLSLTEIDHSI